MFGQHPAIRLTILNFLGKQGLPNPLLNWGVARGIPQVQAISSTKRRGTQENSQ